VPIINTLYRHDRFAWEAPRVFQGPSARDITRA
jgi:hypothetical protein